MLEDCGCVVESHAIEEYLGNLMRSGKVAVHRCPACEQPITKTLRFMSYVKKMYYHVANVKKKLFGLDSQLTEMRSQVIEKLKEFYRFEEKGKFYRLKTKLYN